MTEDGPDRDALDADGIRPDPEAEEIDEEAAVEALSRFGLTTYEARTFVALHRLGVGTASEVAEVADVPRSQVYGAAEGLEERGLVEVQQSSPTRYRPVDLEEARARLYRDVRREGERAFEYVERVQGTHREENSDAESVWTVAGREATVDRVVDLLDAAEERVVYATDDPSRLESRVVDALEACAERGVAAVTASVDDEVYRRFETLDGVSAHRVPPDHHPDVSAGRLLLVDGEAFLLSVVDTDYLPEARETAIWGAETGFADVIVALLAEWQRNALDLSD